MHGLKEQESATSTGKGRAADRVVSVHTGWTDGERFCLRLSELDVTWVCLPIEETAVRTRGQAASIA